MHKRILTSDQNIEKFHDKVKHNSSLAIPFSDDMTKKHWLRKYRIFCHGSCESKIDKVVREYLQEIDPIWLTVWPFKAKTNKSKMLFKQCGTKDTTSLIALDIRIKLIHINMPSSIFSRLTCYIQKWQKILASLIYH